MPYFSIVIPTYNRAHLIHETLETVLKQTFTDWECWVVDDGSKDNTKEVVEHFSQKDSRIKYLYQQNAERGAARNNGYAHSKGKYLCFLDSDDHFYPNHLATLHREIQLKNETVALFFTNAMMKDENGVLSERECPDIKNIPVFDYILRYTFNPARVAVHRNIIEKHKFDPTIPGLEDLDLWLRIALHYPIYQINERTILYNLHSETYTIGDLKRFEKEEINFKYIFSKPELKGKLNPQLCNRLLSMCHYHLALKADTEKSSWKFFRHAFSCLILYPKGYNNNTYKTLVVLLIYNIPILGRVLRVLKSKQKST